MRRGLVFLLLPVFLTACHEQWGSTTWGGAPASSDEQAAETNVRASIPAIEAYYADNGTYEGATLEGLRSVYDAALPDVLVVEANDQSYCVESTVGSSSYFKAGPASDIFPGHCGDEIPAEPPPPTPSNHTDAQSLVLSVIPAIEVYYAENRTYAGLEDTREVNGVSLAQVRIYVNKGGEGYCVEGPRQAPSAHYVGPVGRLVEGPC
jgi:hypothetical protein